MFFRPPASVAAGASRRGAGLRIRAGTVLGRYWGKVILASMLDDPEFAGNLRLVRTLTRVTRPADASSFNTEAKILVSKLIDAEDVKDPAVTKITDMLAETDVVVVGSEGCLMSYVNGWQSHDGSCSQGKQQIGAMPPEPNALLQEGSILYGNTADRNNDFLVMVARTDICAGEEIFFDYGSNYSLPESLALNPVCDKGGESAC